MGAANRQIDLAPGGRELIPLDAAPSSHPSPASDPDGTLRGALPAKATDSPSELSDGGKATEPQIQRR